jgi:transcriptional regulator with XRE-family HTH domain
MNMLSEYQDFETSSPENRRLQRREKLLVEVTEAIAKVLNEEGISQTELARRLGTTKGYVSQLLNGGRNLTLKTLADVADALGCVIEVCLQDEAEFRRRGEFEVVIMQDRWNRERRMSNVVEFKPRLMERARGKEDLAA